jgi:hypothetical protein
MNRQEEKSRVFPLIQRHLLQKSGGEVKAENLVVMTVQDKKIDKMISLWQAWAYEETMQKI